MKSVVRKRSLRIFACKMINQLNMHLKNEQKNHKGFLIVRNVEISTILLKTSSFVSLYE